MADAQKATRKKLVITGGLGFIGSHVAERLTREYDIAVIDWNKTKKATDRVKRMGAMVIQADVTDKAAWDQLDRIDFILHAAAQTSAEKSKTCFVTDFKSNAMGTAVVAEYAKRHAANVVYCNTIRAYDPDASDEAVRVKGAVSEDCATVDTSRRSQPPYALSKYWGERYLQMYAHMHGINVISHRMSGIVGPAQSGNAMHGWLAHIAECAVKGRRYTVFGDGEQSRDVLHISDLVDLIEMELQRFPDFATGFAVYNVGGGPSNELSINQVISLLEKRHNLKLRYEYGEPRLDEPRHYVSDIERIVRKGWRPEHADPEVILAEIVAWHAREKRDE